MRMFWSLGPGRNKGLNDSLCMCWCATRQRSIEAACLAERLKNMSFYHACTVLWQTTNILHAPAKGQKQYESSNTFHKFCPWPCQFPSLVSLISNLATYTTLIFSATQSLVGIFANYIRGHYLLAFLWVLTALASSSRSIAVCGVTLDICSWEKTLISTTL